MIRTRLGAVAAGILLAVAGTATAANASTQVPQVRIYLENNHHNPGKVTADCGPDGPMLHTALFNDAIGANVVETAKIYREDTGAVVFGPVDVPVAGFVPVDMPYLAGVVFNAYAVQKGDSWPTTQADAIARLTAKPPTADNSQLFPVDYPAAPKCPPNPCDPKLLAAAATVHPTCPPCPIPDVKDVKAPTNVIAWPTCVPETSEPSHEPSSTKPPTTTPPTHTSSPPVTSPSTSTPPSPTPTPSGTPTPTGSTTSPATTPPLAHTGATVLPYALGALVLVGCGGGIVLYTRRARRH